MNSELEHLDPWALRVQGLHLGCLVLLSLRRVLLVVVFIGGD